MTESEKKAKWVKIGFRLRSENLSEQTHTTRALVEGDKDALLKKKYLKPSDLADADRWLAAVDTALKDGTSAELEKLSKTATQNDLLSAIKDDRRELGEISRIVLRDSEVLTSFIQLRPRADTVKGVGEEMKAKLRIVADHAALFADRGIDADWIKTVSARTDLMLKTDGEQEAMIQGLPVKFRDFCEKKGLLHGKLKDLNSAGRALHKSDVEAASRYNLKILYRRGAKRAKAEEKKA